MKFSFHFFDDLTSYELFNFVTVVLTVLCQEKRFEKTRKKHDLSGFNHEPEKGNRYASSGVFFAIQCLAPSLYALCIVPTRLRDSCGHDALTR